MARHYFTYHHDLDGKTVLEIECAIAASAELIGGEPVVSVERVYIDGPDGVIGLDDSKDQILILLADAIAKAAEADDEFCERVIEGEDITYCGLGANDPDGQFGRMA